MGSFIPFQDLNLVPDPTTAISTAAALATIIPKLEPKLEPLDEPPIQFRLQQPYFSSPNLNFTFHSPNPNASIQGSEKNSKHSNDCNEESENYSGDNNVFMEFNRISKEFQAAFSKRMEKFGDVDMLDANSGAIVPIPGETAVVEPPARRRYDKRSSELVRVTDLSATDERYFRDMVRKTRILYDSIRILAAAMEEKRRRFGDLGDSGQVVDGGEGGPPPPDAQRSEGVLGVEGARAVDEPRQANCGAHSCSNREPIATSVVVSGGYEDDEDSGDVIIYTGQGGQDKNSRQCVNQKLEGGNLALERSMFYGIEVRVIRGRKYEGSASGKVYVYDGLYKIVQTWFDVGRSGFGVYKYKLVRMDNQPEMGSTMLRFAESLRTQPLSVRPVGYISLDISVKKENMPVFLYNDIDSEHDPMYYEYIPTTVFPPYVYHVGKSEGCDCVSGCLDDCLCARKNGDEFAYDRNGILLRGKPLIFECGTNCSCPPNCRNRVTQKGVMNRFEVFRSRETGWGVRSLDLIKAGAFICEFAGVVLTREQAQIFSMNGDSLVYPNRFAERWAEWGDLSNVFTDYMRPVYPSIPPLDFAMDVSRMRNVACYMSHSSSPNVLVQLVLYDHNNLLFPHLMLFAMENIPPLRELSLDYGVADEWNGKLRICN
ncbi:SU(VAR)3-9 homolog 9 [Actinidia rufa]|uniref:SU(VAR)3-9 homolog 9 n=1 Tax=Actinidia rufa TaxID=165716 RepID=A0A7J0GJ01_9ERIC|nr:SU(VAR)3-9 homolog 9 [Actinidia rufa]